MTAQSPALAIGVWYLAAADANDTAYPCPGAEHKITAEANDGEDDEANFGWAWTADPPREERERLAGRRVNGPTPWSRVGRGFSHEPTSRLFIHDT